MDQSNAAIRRCWQEWANNDKYQGQINSSSRSWTTVEWEDRAIVRAGVAVSDSSLSTIPYVACTHVSNLTERVEFMF